MTDTGWAFPPAFAAGGGDIAMVSGADEVKQSLQILFATRLTERLAHETYGCNLDQFLFAPVSSRVVIHIEDLIRQAVLRFETRIEGLDVSVDGVETSAWMLIIRVKYRMKDSGLDDRFSFPLNLQP